MSTSAQSSYGFFGPPLKPGAPLARQDGLCRKINLLCDVLEGLSGIGGIRLHKPATAGQWMVDGSECGAGLPAGYSEQEIIAGLRWHTEDGQYKLQIKTAKALIRDFDPDPDEGWEDFIEFKEYDA